MNTAVKALISDAEMAISMLKEGNYRFTNNVRINRNYLNEVYATKEKQEPFAVVISCMDSRTAPELIFDQGLGDIFSIRIAGNVVTPEVIASAEYACKVVGSKVILLLGHSECGAIKGTINNVQLGHLPYITEKIRANIEHHTCIHEITKKHVEAGIKKIKKDSGILGELVDQNEIKIIGGIYDVSTGQVSFLEE
jgi:carbonic anhydrase